MGTIRRVRTGLIAGTLALAMVAMAGAARADVTTEPPSSILILPKIVADGTRDTLIEITNTSNSLVFAHCFYVNGAPVDPTRPPGPTNPPLWQEVDFFLFLTRQQPTQWLVSEGRDVNPMDAPTTPGYGIDPGLIPPAVPGFQGELLCVQVDQSGSPVGGNALIGAATLVGPEGDSSKHNAIGILGIEVDGDNVLNLDGVEYNSCPDQLVFTHFAEGVEDPFLGDGSVVTGRLALVPCTHDLENGIPSQVSVSVLSFDEFEDRLSGNINFICRFDEDLSSTAIAGPDGNPFAPTGGSVFGTWKYSILEPNPVCEGGSRNRLPCTVDADCPNGTCTGEVGLLGVLEQAHGSDSGAVTRSSQNLHTMGEQPGSVITTVDLGLPD
jgi:hypothetical protein